ncbi:MAG: DUF4416 family protein [Gemmatales bacterium]|nr:DUF4416 family protein [Gemmatales bacterium]MDW7993167.1 DUF4416 family protein [Gemmatales bacterium]
MAQPKPHPPVVLIVAAFSRHEQALQWAQQRLQEHFGPILAVSPSFPFDHTDYYTASMGTGLRKQLLAFHELIAPDQLPDIKHLTNTMESELAHSGKFPEPRPINLDPGYLDTGKFILASTKNHAHRIYLRDGIYAEVTLYYENKRFRPWPWTYRDYQQPLVLDFLEQVRTWYRQRLAAHADGT